MPNCNAPCALNPCPPRRDCIFDWIDISFVVAGGTRVQWQVSSIFTDAQPWTFQLQAGTTGSNTADDWVNVGSAQNNICCAIDNNKRVFGKVQYTHYRIKLTTPTNIHFSMPVSSEGTLPLRDRRIAREIIRKETLRFKFVGQEGYLLKLRRTNQDCTNCLDLQTGEITNPDCPECRGTGKTCGYYYPIPCVWAELSPERAVTRIDAEGTRGTIRDDVISARVLMNPTIDEKDIWVSRKTDNRYYIQGVTSAAEIRGIPIVANAEFRLAPYSDIAYTIQIPDQLERAECQQNP